MPQLPLPQQENIEELLRQRGLLATGGNIRLSPFANAPANGANGSGVPGDSSSDPSGTGNVTPNGDGTYTNNATGEVIDPRPVAQEQGIDPNSDLTWLAAMIAGASGAAIGSALGSRRTGKPVDPLAPLPPNSNVPAAPGAAGMSDDIVEGEFRVVDPAAQLDNAQTRGLPAPQQRLSGPRNLIADQPAPPPRLTAQEIARRKAAARAGGNVPGEGSGPTIQSPDKLTDFTPEERAEAYRLVNELVERRRQGNSRRLKGGKGTGRKGLPTSPGLQTEYPEDLLGHVVRVLRDQKAIRNLQKVVR